MLGHPLDAFGEGFGQLDVLLLGGFAHCSHQTPLRGNQVVLDKDPKVPFQYRNMTQQAVPGFTVNHQQLAVLNGIHMVRRGFIGKKTVKIGHPPTFKGKLEDMLAAFVVYGVTPEQPLFHKNGVSTDIPFLKQVLTLPEFLGYKAAPAMIQFLLR